MPALRRAHEGLLTAGLVLSALLVGFMALTVSADVVLRNLGLGGLPWNIEVSEYILFYSTFLAAPWALRQGAHVRVDVLLQFLPARALRPMEAAADVVGLACSLVLLVFGALATADAFRLHSMILKQLAVPEYWLLAGIPLCGAQLTVEFVLRLRRQWVDRNAPTGGSPLKDGI
jgi:TRAP-type C4-dicarboxylate transport system permease small subunit